MPKRIQRKRTKGWKMSEGAVYVGRPTKWGNPFDFRSEEYRAEAVKRGFYEEPKCFARALAVRDYESGIKAPVGLADLKTRGRFINIRDSLKLLRGKDLACWCSLEDACHADVLLELANGKSD